MKAYDGSHTESQIALPEPLSAAGVWNVGALALPAVMLSVCSAAVFALVALILRMGSGRDLFRLPFPGTFAIGAVAASAAWVIAVKCRHRPGRLWPRVWSLLLAVVNTCVALLALVFHAEPLVLAFAVAGLAAAAALAPRLSKLRPDSPLVQWIAPFSMTLILLVILPASCAVRNTITKKTEDRVEQRIRQLRLWRAEVREGTGFDWRRMEERPEAAAGALAKLKGLSFAGTVDDAEVWHWAAILGKDEDLAAAMRGLTAEVVTGFAPERLPRVSNLREPAMRWDAQNGRWVSYTQFGPLSGITGSYHQELGRLFSELASDDGSATNAKLLDYREHYAAQRVALEKHLDTEGRSWADQWVVSRVRYEGARARPQTPLNELLRTPFIESEEGSLAAGQLWQLTALPLERLKTMARGTPGCDAAEPVPGASRRAPGCLCQSYDESGREYFRLDCYAYAPRAVGTGAELRVEMRLVYGSPVGGYLTRFSLPEEVYFHFLIPHGVRRAEFSEGVMMSVAGAARESAPGARYRTNRGGSPAGGFSLHSGPISVEARAPKIESLKGLVPETEAVIVRVIRASNRQRVFGGENG